MIRVNNLTKTYDRHSRNASAALHGVSFDLPDTGFVCIVGPSGCGKTSLLNAVGGLDVFDGGSVSTDDLDNLRCGSRLTEAERNRSFGYIFQNYYLLPEYSAAYNVYLGLHSLELSHKEKLRRVTEALRAVDMERFARRAVGDMSGGQQQRVAIARALARRPRVIFADEPTGNLDEANTMNICTLLRRISRSSLVVMVTHEERIARFFADRIITLEAGTLKEDNEGWQRSDMSAAGSTIYTGEYAETAQATEGLELRLLRGEGAAPVKLTVVTQKDRVVIKIDDPRVVTCGCGTDTPKLEEGDRPVLTLEALEQEGALDLSGEDPTKQGRAGSGLTISMLFREAKNLLSRKGVRLAGTWLFLAVLTVLTLLSVGDYLKVSSIDPETFITTDSHILEFNFDRGENMSVNNWSIQSEVVGYLEYLEASGLEFDYVPHVPTTATYTSSLFWQMRGVSVPVPALSYVPLHRLDESALIAGRMPETSYEIVVDRWVLQDMLERDGIVQSGISDVSYFLGRRLNYVKKNYIATIVGISDCGEPAIFMSASALASLGIMGTEVVTLSELRSLAPGSYDDLTLAEGECVVILNNIGSGYANKVGRKYDTRGGRSYIIKDAIEEEAVYASLVVADEEIETLTRSMMSNWFYLYCTDKEAMKAYLNAGFPEEFAHLEGVLRVTVTDKNSDGWAQYRAATTLRMDGRRIVTVTVIALCLVMLYLLQRSRIQERIGMIAVYRLLGIPGRKLAVIFTLECALLALLSTLPVTVVVWLVVALLNGLLKMDLLVLLPWYAGAVVFAGITVFHILVSVLPLFRLLRMPPARLAAKYDI